MYHAMACLTVTKLSNLGEHSELSQARSLHTEFPDMDEGIFRKQHVIMPASTYCLRIAPFYS